MLAGSDQRLSAAHCRCSTAVNVGFQGTDVHSAAFKSGPQITQLNSYSIVSLYYKAQAAVEQTYTNINQQWCAPAQGASFCFCWC